MPSRAPAITTKRAGARWSGSEPGRSKGAVADWRRFSISSATPSRSATFAYRTRGRALGHQSDRDRFQSFDAERLVVGGWGPARVTAVMSSSVTPWYFGVMKTCAFLAALALPSVAVAHPGHGAVPGDSVWHWICEPLHALPLAAGVVLLTLAMRTLQRRSR